MTVNKPGPEPARFQSQERTLTPYVPGQMAIAFTGTFLSLDSLDPRQKDALPRRTLDQVTLDGLTLKNRGVAHSVDDLDWAMEPGWRLYHFGLVQGVLVADPNKFYGPHHREGLVAWYPFNEHPRDGLTIVDHSGVSDSINQPLLNPDGRLFDSRRGGLTGAISLGFWVRSPGTTARTSIIQIGGLSVDLMASTIIASTSTLYLSRALVSGWNYVALRYDPDATTWSIYSGTTDSAIVFGSSSVTAH
ncbi:MAG: hypothetical protein JZU63_12620, partial [Rhodoferax sp.]|nr:hypothetical protein [Rhodoferax sp.]